MSKIILTDGGLETDLIFNRNIELPHFAAFTLLDNVGQIHELKVYYQEHLKVAQEHRTGFILESPTWRANTDWGYLLGYSKHELADINRRSILFLQSLRSEVPVPGLVKVSGQVGPRSDGYVVTEKMEVVQAKSYHYPQIKVFTAAGADMASALTMNYINEAMGIALAAQELSLPVVISFTVETDGLLASGESLEQAIRVIDEATGSYPLYYMINCAHPTHFKKELEERGAWTERIHGIRANASCKSHAELDEATELDPGDKKELAEEYAELKQLLPNLAVVGGCCGTDVSHIECIAQAVV